MRQGLVAFQRTGAEIGRPRYLAMLAAAYGNVGPPEEGLALLIEALTVAQTTGEQFYEAEFHRLAGELTLKQSSFQSLESRDKKSSKSKVQKNLNVRDQRLSSEAEECFQRAIEMARRQRAKSIELRAAVSLSRLWQQQGKKDEARQMLAEIYGWFTEGFDTKDLQEAKALLVELA